MYAKGTILVLIDNHASDAGLVAEHGLAVHLDLGTRRLLFDTGQTDAILANAARLGVDLASVDTVALSHGHYDHTGGLAEVLAGIKGEVTVYAHAVALHRKYHCTAAGARSIGMPDHCLESLRQSGVNPRTVTGPTEIAPGVFLTGEVPRRHRQEQDDEGFRLDPEGSRIDSLPDDQSLFVPTPAGTVVLLGCAHSGVINTLDYIRHLTDGQPIKGVLGGMHLRSASDERLAWTIDALRSLSIERLYPAHCTGARATAAFEAAFPGRCFPCGVGLTLNI
jgi:7,8-dihydropterin-6-yl-methyl-4-(beta-D-ribofuranosyl)aminobenzene 5'-phosphate synthase